jgi:hypothetical protein
MVDALRESRRVLTSRGILVDVRPVTAPMVVEVVIATRAIWATEVNSYGGSEDDAATDAAVQHALSHDWFVFERRRPFDFEIYCDTAADLKSYAQMNRRIQEAEIPYEMLEVRRSELTDGSAGRLRCRRPWMLSKYRRSHNLA